MAADKRGKRSPVGAGSLDPERHDLPEARSPFQQLLEPGRVGRDRQGREDPADRVHHRCDVDVLVRVDADHDVPGPDGLDLGHVCCLSFTG